MKMRGDESFAFDNRTNDGKGNEIKIDGPRKDISGRVMKRGNFLQWTQGRCKQRRENAEKKCFFFL